MFALEISENVLYVSFEELLGVWVFCGDVLGPIYDEDVLVWLEDDVIGAEVCVDYVGVLVSFSYIG